MLRFSVGNGFESRSPNERVKSTSYVRRSAAFVPHRLNHARRHLLIVDVEAECGPVGVDQAQSSARAEYSCQFGDRGLRVGQPLQGAFATGRVEGLVRLIQVQRVADQEPDRACRVNRSLPGDFKHRCTDVYPHERSARAKYTSERERSITEPAANIQEPFTCAKVELVLLP